MGVARNLARILERLKGTKVTLVAVSKAVGLNEIREAFECGATEFGENRIQDALAKQEQIPPQMTPHIHWHFIGHLQTNKAKKAVGRFSLIHSVDSERLAKEISDTAIKSGACADGGGSARQPVLLQVKIADDPSKSGFSKEQLLSGFDSLRLLPGLDVRGLMTMTPLTDSKEIWRQCFNGTRDTRDELQRSYGVQLPELSMGMTDDWEEAVACGATMIRLGRAIFAEMEN